MSAWTFANKETGALSRKKYSGPEGSIEANTPTGFIAIEGDYDPLCQRFDLNALAIVDYIPPQPSSDHEWNGRRWVLTSMAEKELEEDRNARASLESLDLKQQRYIAEKVLGVIDDEGERRLAEIMELKQAARERLKKPIEKDTNEL